MAFVPKITVSEFVEREISIRYKRLPIVNFVNLIKSDYVNKTNPIVVQILKNSQNNSYDIHHHDIHYDSNM